MTTELIDFHTAEIFNFPDYEQARNYIEFSGWSDYLESKLKVYTDFDNHIISVEAFKSKISDEYCYMIYEDLEIPKLN